MHSLQRKCTCDELFAHPLGLNLQNQAEQLNSAWQLNAAIVAQCLSAKSCYKSECGGRPSIRDTEIKGSLPEGDQKAHKYTCFARSASCCMYWPWKIYIVRKDQL